MVLKTGYTSTVNSSTTAINNGSNFTGTWENVSGYNSLVVAVKTDQDGYYEIQFSPDGTNQDSTLTRYYRTSQIEPPHRFTITRDYFRVVFYNNSGSNQTYFRLQTQVGEKEQLNIPLDSTMSQDYDAIAVRPTDFHKEVALGRRQGWVTWNKFGYNEDIDTTTDPEVIASFGGSWSPATSAETLDVVSSDTNDDGSPAGTGARTIRITGVDTNWAVLEEDVTLDGTTTVTTTGSFLGINRVVVLTVGSGGINAGTISITGNSSSNNYAEIPASEGTTQQCIFHVPADHTFLTEWLWVNARKLSGGSSPRITVKAWVYAAVTGAKYEVARINLDTSVDNQSQLLPPVPFPIEEKQVIWLEAETDTNNTVVTGRFSGELARYVDA